MQPRKPTEQEKKELLDYLVLDGVYEVDQAEEFYKWVNNAPLVVFDNYRTDYPAYNGKVLTILPTYDLYPAIVQVFIWHKGKITEICDEDDMSKLTNENLDARHK